MSNNKNKICVRIINPAGSSYTNLASAERYVRRGRARWVQDEHGRACLEFVEYHRTFSKIPIRTEEVIGYDQASNTGLASIESLRNTPFTDPMKMLVRRSRRAA